MGRVHRVAHLGRGVGHARRRKVVDVREHVGRAQLEASVCVGARAQGTTRGAQGEPTGEQEGGAQAAGLRGEIVRAPHAPAFGWNLPDGEPVIRSGRT